MFEGKQKAYDVCCKLCVVCVCCVLFGVPIRPSPFWSQRSSPTPGVCACRHPWRPNWPSRCRGRMCLKVPPRRASNRTESPSSADRSQPYASSCQLWSNAKTVSLVRIHICGWAAPAYPQLKKLYIPKLGFGIGDNGIQVILNTWLKLVWQLWKKGYRQHCKIPPVWLCHWTSFYPLLETKLD